MAEQKNFCNWTTNPVEYESSILILSRTAGFWGFWCQLQGTKSQLGETFTIP